VARVELTAGAKEDVRDLDGAARRLVFKALKKLEDNPGQRGQPLGKGLATFRKLVVGDRDYRIVYRLEADGTVVVVWVVGKRADDYCYDLAMSRLKTHADRVVAGEIASLVEGVWASTRDA
jgi:mRNA interferase RelE/StbE